MGNNNNPFDTSTRAGREKFVNDQRAATQQRQRESAARDAAQHKKTMASIRRQGERMWSSNSDSYPGLSRPSDYSAPGDYNISTSSSASGDTIRKAFIAIVLFCFGVWFVDAKMHLGNNGYALLISGVFCTLFTRIIFKLRAWLLGGAVVIGILYMLAHRK